MKISKIRIKNFRSFKNLELSDISMNKLIVGQNNSGKSNLLKAIDCVFNNRYLATENDIYNNIEDGDRTVIDVMISTLNENNKFSEEWIYVFEEHISKNNGKDTFSIRCVINKNQESGRFEIDRFPILNWESLDIDPRGKFLNRKIRQCITSFHITSDRDIIREVRIRSSNFSKLLKESNLNLSYEDTTEIEEKLNQVNLLISERLPNLKGIEEDLSQITSTLKNMNTIKLLPIPNKLTDLDKGIEIFVTENEKSMPVDFYGDGTRSWMSILALKSFANLLKTQNEIEGLPFFPILLIEEPESHLHNHAQVKIIEQLVELNSEIIITTHSTNVLSSINDFQVIRLFKDNGESKFATVNKDQVDSEFYLKFKSLIIPYYTDIFFSESVILVEGISDRIFIENYYEKKFNNKLISIGVSVINTDGSSNIPLFRMFCHLYNIKNIVYTDLDTIKTVTELLKKNNLSKDSIFVTDDKELEYDIVNNNLEDVLLYYISEEKKPNQYITKIREEKRLEKILIDYLCDHKTSYPFNICSFISADFKVPSLDNLIKEMENKL